MRELADSDITVLYELIWKFFHALERPVVQVQLMGIIINCSLAWLMTQGILILWQKRFPSMKNLDLSDHQLSLKYYITGLLRHLLTPGLSLVGVAFLRNALINHGWRIGIITVANQVLWIFLAYRLFLLICYSFFPSKTVTRYRFKFWAPLLILYIINTLISLLTKTQELSQVEVLQLFDSPVTLGEILLMTVGFYFWIIGVSIVEETFLYINFLVAKNKTGGAKATSIIIRYSLIGIGIVLFFGFVGVSPNAVAAVSGGLSVGIGFSLKEIIGNFISGLGLLFEGSLRPGDMLEVEGEATTVQKVSIRATTVITFDNIEKIVPNQYFFTNIVRTYTGTDPIIRVLVPVGVSYQCDPEEVIEILLGMAYQNQNVLSEPRPYVHLMGYGNSSIDFRLSVFINDPSIRLTVRSDLYRSIWKALAANNIEIPYPQTDLHIRSDRTKHLFPDDTTTAEIDLRTDTNNME